MDQSKGVISNQLMQTAFKRPLETASESEEQSTPATLTREQRNSHLRIWRTT